MVTEVFGGDVLGFSSSVRWKFREEQFLAIDVVSVLRVAV